MEQIVYIDLYFLINFAMDLLGFFLVSRLLSIRHNFWRVLAAAGVGALYACLSLFVPISGFLAFAVDIIACLIICTIAYVKRGELRYLAENTIVYAAVSILLGGFMTVLFDIFNRIGMDELFDGGDSDGISVWLFAILAAVSGILAAKGGKFFRKKTSRRECTVRLQLDDRQVEVKALCDSGNLLRDPISALPCIMVGSDVIKKLLSVETYSAFVNGVIGSLPSFEARRFRIIPMRTVNGESIVYAFRADEIKIDFGAGARKVNALVAVSPGPIKSKGFDALVPTELSLF